MNNDYEEVVYFNFDFSINKPAGLFVYLNKNEKRTEMEFHGWPRSITKSHIPQLEGAGIVLHIRDLPAIKAKENTVSETVREHTVRSIELANDIIQDMIVFIRDNCTTGNVKLYLASEGLSFMSKGDAGLNLAGYKFVFLGKVYETFKDITIMTYAPMTIKSTAGCAGKKSSNVKEPMIEAFIKEEIDHPFTARLDEGDLLNSGGKNYITMVDDLCDSYWVYRTLINDIYDLKK